MVRCWLYFNKLRLGGCDRAPSQRVFLLTGSVEHDQGCRMFLQEAVKGLVGQVKDRGARLWPGHLRGLWLRGLRTDTEIENTDEEPLTKKKKKNADTHWSWSVICTETEERKKKKSNTAVVHVPPNMSHTHNRTSGSKQPRLVDGARRYNARNRSTPL